MNGFRHTGKPRRHILDDSCILHIQKLVEADRLTYKQIAERLGCCVYTVRRFIKKHNIKLTQKNA